MISCHRCMGHGRGGQLLRGMGHVREISCYRDMGHRRKGQLLRGTGHVREISCYKGMGHERDVSLLHVHGANLEALKIVYSSKFQGSYLSSV